MNQAYARVNQPYATLTLASALREMFGVQLYKNNASALLSRILSILNLDWLQHARSVRGVYEYLVSHGERYIISSCLSILVTFLSWVRWELLELATVLTLSCLPIYPMSSLKVFYQNMDYYNELNIYQKVLNEFRPNFAETW